MIDGAATPDSIPDDRAYHVVILTAAAAPTDTTIEKQRAISVANKIVAGSEADSAALAEAANRYSASFRQFSAQKFAGTSDAYEENKKALLASRTF